MNNLPKRPRFEKGFLLLESVAAVLVLAILFAAVVPAWLAVQSRHGLAVKSVRASELAVAELERASAGVLLPDSRAVEEPSGRYEIRVNRMPDPAGSFVRIIVSFRERGREHAVSYEALVP